MKIYRLTKTVFDSLENDLAEARRTYALGTFLYEQDAVLYKDQDKAKSKPYKGWDKKTYPQYRIEASEVIEGVFVSK